MFSCCPSGNSVVELLTVELVTVELVTVELVTVELVTVEFGHIYRNTSIRT